MPPDRQGLISQPDQDALAGLGERIADFKGRMVADGVSMGFSSNPRGVNGGQLLGLSSNGGYWSPDPDDGRPTVSIDFDRPRLVDSLVLRERIAVGQRLEEASVRLSDQESDLLARTGTVGYQRIVTFAPVRTDHLELVLDSYRGIPTLESVIPVESVESVESR